MGCAVSKKRSAIDGDVDQDVGPGIFKFYQCGMGAIVRILRDQLPPERDLWSPGASVLLVYKVILSI